MVGTGMPILKQSSVEQPVDNKVTMHENTDRLSFYSIPKNEQNGELIMDKYLKKENRVSNWYGDVKWRWWFLVLAAFVVFCGGCMGGGGVFYTP